ncbi:hypothetical protein LCGC14_1153150 [marine sediment metagenome]|uniref:Uncharacterized protein n=1 Tax=marine sediment metagenome TaxID=412755 RepID=A0A0F9PD27_9ZZZZ
MSEVSAIITRLVDLKEQQDRLASEATTLWTAFYQIADREAGKNKAYRYLDEETGLVLGRVMRRGDTLDTAALEAGLTPKQWLSVTQGKRVLDEARLEVAMQKDDTVKAAVDTAMERKMIASKLGPGKATKEELEELEERRQEQAR